MKIKKSSGHFHIFGNRGDFGDSEFLNSLLQYIAKFGDFQNIKVKKNLKQTLLF
jgi:hypothetical protein